MTYKDAVTKHIAQTPEAEMLRRMGQEERSEMTEEKEVKETGLTLPSEDRFISDIKAINRFQEVVKENMIPGLDYGVIPGTPKPTLLKPGAEKMAKLLGLADHYEIEDKIEDWDKPFFRYLIRCSLVSVASGITISEGLGECNSMESKYRWREAKRVCPDCGAEAIIKGKVEYGGGWVCFKKQGGCGSKFEDNAVSIIGQETGRVENDDIYSLVNTILKMATKRALVGAALSAGRLSAIFTQDIEDMGEQKAEIPAEDKPAPKSTPKSKTAITDGQIEAIKKVTRWDDDEIYLRAVTKFGWIKDIHDVTEHDAGQWILKLQKENK